MENQTLKIREMLAQIGLSAKEISVYLGLLEIGRGTVSQISRKAGINRTTGYDILDSLLAKGLVSVSGKEPKQEYVAESPDQITKYLEEKIKRDQESLEKAKKMLPELKTLHNVSDRPKVRFYEGTQGLIDVYDDTLTATEPIIAYASYDDMHSLMPNYFTTYYKRRAAAGISARGIVPATEMAFERKDNNDKELRELVLVPKDKYNFTPDIEIYDNKIMIASWKEKLGIIIESAEIADAMKKIFELAWIGANVVKVEEK
jgi:sugar-specific transcriptional regulator TrmB